MKLVAVILICYTRIIAVITKTLKILNDHFFLLAQARAEFS